jgi:uncharacterized protein YcaQ
MVRHHFAPCRTQMEAFDRLRSIQFDPIAPVGCNHDLVLQARVPGYKVGDWQKVAYDKRKIYDGWDKQACLVPFEGWPLRRLFYTWYRNRTKFFDNHPEAIATVLGELEAHGPLMPKHFEFQEQKPEWKGSWHGTSMTKQTLRALWGSGLVMTAGRRKGQHIYDLTERVVPPHIYAEPWLSEYEALRELTFERHRAVGILRPNAQWEVWSFNAMGAPKRTAIQELVDTGRIIPLDIEGVKAHATPEFLTLLDKPSIPAKVKFIAPLDQFIWDRKMIGHMFDFEYLWEIYTPEHKRRWGYYVLPVLYGNALVGRVEFWARHGVLEIRRWHFEAKLPGPKFMDALTVALKEFMNYCSATSVRATSDVDPKIRNLVESIT